MEWSDFLPACRLEAWVVEWSDLLEAGRLLATYGFIPPRFFISGGFLLEGSATRSSRAPRAAAQGRGRVCSLASHFEFEIVSRAVEQLG